MTIVQINCSANGSTGNIAKAIHRKLLNEGHNSYIFYEQGKPEDKNMFRIGNYFELHTHAVLSRNLGLQGYFSYFATYRLIRKLKKISPDIIHLHNLHGSYLNLPMLFCYLKRSEVKVVITLHDCWLFTGKCPHFTVVGCNKWQECCGKCPQLSTYPRSKIDITKKLLKDKKKWLTGFGDRLQIVAVSNWLRDTAKQSFLNRYSIKTIYNGINTDIFYPRETSRVKIKYGLNGKVVILGVASGWGEAKGLKEFLALAQKLSPDEVIVLVGLTAEQCQNMPNHIIGIERTENQDELAELYSAADVFVNPSKEETFGMVTAEALACGTPVIVYNSTACAEIVNNTCGIILDPVDSNLRKAIDTIKRCKYKPTADWIYSSKKMVEGYIYAYEKHMEMRDQS